MLPFFRFAVVVRFSLKIGPSKSRRRPLYCSQTPPRMDRLPSENVLGGFHICRPQKFRIFLPPPPPPWQVQKSSDFVPFIFFLGTPVTPLPPLECGRQIWKPPTSSDGLFFAHPTCFPSFTTWSVFWTQRRSLTGFGITKYFKTVLTRLGDSHCKDGYVTN